MFLDDIIYIYIYIYIYIHTHTHTTALWKISQNKQKKKGKKEDRLIRSRKMSLRISQKTNFDRVTYEKSG